jgi:hypothetical protein
MTAPVPATAVELREAQRIEYSTYVAVVPIDIGGARAFNVGDPVPVSHVENKVVGESEVAKLTTKAGKEAAGVTEPTKS